MHEYNIYKKALTVVANTHKVSRATVKYMIAYFQGDYGFNWREEPATVREVDKLFLHAIERYAFYTGTFKDLHGFGMRKVKEIEDSFGIRHDRFYPHFCNNCGQRLKEETK